LILDDGCPDASGRDLAVADFQFASFNWMLDAGFSILDV
jgi:hypothetical protein